MNYLKDINKPPEVMIRNSKLLKNAPYAYLSSNEDDSMFELFLLIFLNPGKFVKFSDPDYYTDMVCIDINVLDAQNINKDYEPKYYKLDPRLILPYFNMEESKIVIRVFWQDEATDEQDIHKVVMYFKDADKSTFSPKVNDMALNSPYVFLDRVATIPENNTRKYWPYLAIPVQGYAPPATTNQEIRKLSTENGICETQITLEASTNGNGQVTMVHNSLVINNVEYSANGKHQGNFTAHVTLNGSQGNQQSGGNGTNSTEDEDKPRKGKTRNM